MSLTASPRALATWATPAADPLHAAAVDGTSIAVVLGARADHRVEGEGGAAFEDGVVDGAGGERSTLWISALVPSR